MVKWYDRIGNTIEMYVNGEWIKGTVINGERTGDGIINMETANGEKYWCGVCSGYYTKAEDSLGDLITQADRIRAMSDEELAEFLEKVEVYAYNDRSIAEDEHFHMMDMLQWLKSEAKE